MKEFFKKNWQEILLVVFIGISLVLRFNGIFKLNFFTFDQSRDALYVKRILVDKEFRLLGTQTSLPGMYLPPFYYYTIAPILWLFKLNPIGIDVYTAFIGTLSVPLVFFIANKIFGRPAGIFSAGLWTVSSLMVELTRRAWNPNTLPFFILIAFYFFYQYFKEKKRKDFIFGTVFYGYCLSLHFGAWTLLPLWIASFIFFTVKSKKITKSLIVVGIIIFFVSPLLFFEVRHGFFLFFQAKKFFFEGNRIAANFRLISEQFITSLAGLFLILLSGKASVGYGAPLGFSGKLVEFFTLPQPVSVVAQKPYSFSFAWWGIILLVLILLISFFKRKELSIKIIWTWLIWGILASWLYRGGLQFFYYLYLFPVVFLLFGLLGYCLYQSKIKVFKYGALVGFLAITLFHIRNTVAFASTWRSSRDLRAVAEIIANNVSPEVSFNIATVQRDLDRWDRTAVDYRYFTETFFGKRALDWFPEDFQKAEELFVIDETGKTDILNSPIMEIQTFNPGEIKASWTIENDITIYQLTKKNDK